MTDIASLVSALAPLAEEVGFLPEQIGEIVGLRSRRWPVAADGGRGARLTQSQVARAEMLLEVCVAATSLMGDRASEWLDDWFQQDRAHDASGARSRDAIGRLRLELRRQYGLA